MAIVDIRANSDVNPVTIIPDELFTHIESNNTFIPVERLIQSQIEFAHGSGSPMC